MELLLFVTAGFEVDFMVAGGDLDGPRPSWNEHRDLVSVHDDPVRNLMRDRIAGAADCDPRSGLAAGRSRSPRTSR